MKYIVAFVLAFVFVASGVPMVVIASHESADSTTALLDQIIDINLADATLLLAISKLAVVYRVPIGFEQSIDSRANPNRQIHLEPGTLKTILDSLVKQEPAYKWELRDGAINITPRAGRDGFLARLLDTKVAQFVPPATTDKFKIRDAVLSCSKYANC